jgi:hypothetical protein
MAIFKGPVSARRYRVFGELPDNWRESYLDRLTSYAAKSPSLTGENSIVITMGAALQDNLLDTNFVEVDRWLNDPYVVFTFRVDRLELPKAKIKARVAQQIRIWCRENEQERAPNAIRRQIKENVELELRSENRIKMSATDVAWNTRDGSLWFGSCTERLNDDFRKWFLRCFGMKLSPVELAGRFSVNDRDAEPEVVFPSNDLLGWIFYVSINGGVIGESGEDFRLFVGDRVVFAGEGSTKITVKADNASDKPESKRAIGERRTVEELDFSIERGGEMIATLAMKGAYPDVLKVRSIGAVDEGSSEAERRVVTMVIYEGLVAEVDAIAKRFLEVRENDKAWAEVQSGLIAWSKTVTASKTTECTAGEDAAKGEL